MADEPQFFASWEAAGIYGVEPHGHEEQAFTCPQCSADRKPEHQRTKCLSVNVVKEVFKCNHCSWRGGLDRERRDLPAGRPKARAWVRPEPPATRLLPKSVLRWFAGRGISQATLEHWGIYYAKTYMRESQQEEHTSAFPHTRDGVVINVQYRTSDKKFKLETGAERCFYGLDTLKNPRDPLVIVEGQIDALSCYEVGYRQVLSPPNGAPDPKSQNLDNYFHYLDIDMETLEPYEKIILAGDNDAPGRRLMEELARRLGVERCWQVTWPDDCKDANDVLVAHGKPGLQACLDAAQAWPIEGIKTVRSLMPSIEDLYHDGAPKTTSAGWSTMDPFYRIQLGDFTLITGVPSHGKTRYTSNMLLNLARQEGWRLTLFSPEAKPRRTLQTLIEQYVGKPLHGVGRMALEELWEAGEFMDEHFSIISPGTHKGSTVTELLAYAAIEVKRRGIKGVLLDPWSYITKTPERGQSVTDYVAEKITEIKTWTAHHDCHLWLVAHPTKMRQAVDGDYKGKVPPPTAYDISDSAHWFNGPDSILSIWRDIDLVPSNLLTEVHVQKIRDEYVGTTGMVTLQYDPYTKRYSDLISATGPSPWEAPTTESPWQRTYPSLTQSSLPIP